MFVTCQHFLWSKLCCTIDASLWGLRHCFGVSLLSDSVSVDCLDLNTHFSTAVMDNSLRTFQTWDYVVFSCLFVVSSGIGVFFAVKERKKASSKEFLVGGRQMTFGPVALSLTASFMSAVTVLGAPSDVYRFGASFVIFGVAYTFVVICTAELFLPVFYRSGITSTYEVLQKCLFLCLIYYWQHVCCFTEPHLSDSLADFVLWCFYVSSRFGPGSILNWDSVGWSE